MADLQHRTQHYTRAHDQRGGSKNDPLDTKAEITPKSAPKKKPTKQVKRKDKRFAALAEGVEHTPSNTEPTLSSSKQVRINSRRGSTEEASPGTRRTSDDSQGDDVILDDRFARDDLEEEEEEESDEEEGESDDEEEEDDEDPDDAGVQEWREGLAALAELDERLKAVHPKLQDTRQLIPDKHVIDEVRRRRNPTLSLTAKLMCGIKPHLGGEPVEKGGWTIPRLIVVTGHFGARGNQGMNGVYQRYPDDHHKRPVYHKVLEKRPTEDGMRTLTVAMPQTGPDIVTRVPASRYRGPAEITAPLRGTMPYFLFFDNGQGCWCLGPQVGECKKVCAKCPAPDELVPSNLTSWVVWDVGQKEWYSHKSLKTVKGGI